MLPQERYQKTTEYLKSHRMIRIDQMAEMFQISVETARRDLAFLQKEGVIRKVYGGATLVQKEPKEIDNAVRMERMRKEKQAIGRKCAEFIEDGDQVLIGVGTTTLQAARALKEKRDLTVITNSLPVVNELLDTDFHLYIIGGSIRHEEGAVSGAIATQQMENFSIGKAIIGAGGITLKNGLSDYHIEEALLRRKIVERAGQVIVAADSTKFGRDVLTHICPLSSVSVIVTDSGLPHSQIDALREAGTELALADL